MLSGLETDANGTILQEGLEPGTFYIVETSAPAGYKKLTGSIEAAVAQDQTTTITVENTLTGEHDYQTGTDDYNLLIGGGVLLILGAAAILFSRRKRVKE